MNIEELILKTKPTLAVKSLKSYVGNIKNILVHYETENINILNNFESIIDYIEEKNSYLTKRNYLNSIIVLLQHDKELNNDIIKKYIEVRDEYNERYKMEQATNTKSDKQTKNWINLSQIKDILKDLEKNIKDEQHMIWWFMLNFWVNYPIRNDLQYTNIISKKKYNKLLNKELEKKNYFVLDDRPFLSISQYKTFKKYGVKKIEMNDSMIKILLKYLSRNPTKYILYNVKDKSPMSSSDITNNFRELFKKYYPDKSISTNMLRHIITTELFGKTLEQMTQLANIMCHDIGTQQKIYIKK